MASNSSSWCAVYTRSRFEKKVYSAFTQKSIEAYLPLNKQLKVWSDRKKWVEEPLVRSYVFVKIREAEYLNVLQTPGVIKIIQFEGRIAWIPEGQIETLKRVMNGETELEVANTFFKPGDPVEVVSGNLKGVCGELVEYKGNKKVLIQIDHVTSSVLLNISPQYLKFVDKKENR